MIDVYIGIIQQGKRANVLSKKYLMEWKVIINIMPLNITYDIFNVIIFMYYMFRVHLHYCTYVICMN